MKHRVRFLIPVLLAAFVFVFAGHSMAEADHGGAVDPNVGQDSIDPSATQNKLYKLISACLDARPGSGATSSSGLGSTLGGTNGESLFNSTCLRCHGKKDAQRSIACINGPCLNFSQMPPGAPLPPDQKAAIIGFLQNGG